MSAPDNIRRAFFGRRWHQTALATVCGHDFVDNQVPLQLFLSDNKTCGNVKEI
jgi:hypothetical protein